MKLATFRIGDALKVGLVDDAAATIATFQLPAEQARRGIQHLIELQVAGSDLPATDAAIAFDEVTFEAPLPHPRRNIFCVGKNYHDHAHEFSSSGFDSSAAQGAVPQHPIVFSKVPESVTGPQTFIEFDPAVSAAIDYEVELAVIIGKPGRGISREKALDHV